MKTLFVTVIFVLVFSATGFAQKCNEYTIPGDVFAFCPPARWKATQKEDSKDIEFESTSKASKFPTSITIMGKPRTAARDLLSLTLIKGTLGGDAYKDPRLVGISDFKLPSGLDATSMIFYMDNDGLPVALAYILVDGPRNKNIDFMIFGPRDDTATGKLVNDAIGTLRAK